jgi:hypothetical protein
MLQQKKRDALFQLLKAMPLCSKDDVSGFSRWMQRIGKADDRLARTMIASLRWAGDGDPSARITIRNSATKKSRAATGPSHA